MVMPSLTLPEEPRALRSMARTLLDQAPETGLSLIVGGEWIADPLWECWRDLLREHGMDRERFGQIVADNGNELRLWVVGERPWQQYISGLAGRVTRRLSPSATSTGNGAHQPWRDALGRVGVAPDDEMARLISRIGELHLLYDVAAPNGQEDRSASASAASAIVWAGGRPRDPEVPFGEGRLGIILSRAGGGTGAIPAQGPGLPAAIRLRLRRPLIPSATRFACTRPLGAGRREHALGR